MRQDYAEFEKRSCAILNLGPDSAKKYRDYWEKHNLPFVGLSDPKSRVAKNYAQPVRLLKLGRMPMQVIVDKEGILRYRHDGNSMQDIPNTDAVLAELDKLQ